MRVVVSSCGSINGVTITKVLQAEGIEVVGLDANPNAVGFSMADYSETVFPVDHPDYIDLLKSILRRYDVKIIFPTYSRELPLFATKWNIWQRWGYKWMVSPLFAIKICDDKLLTATFLKEHEIRHPRIYRPSQAQDHLDKGGVIFAKLRHGSGSVRTKILHNSLEVYNYTHFDTVPAEKPIFQEYILGTEYTVNMVSGYDGIVIGAVPVQRMVIRGGLSVLCQSENQPEVEKVARDVAEHLGLVGASNVQIIVTPSGEPVVIEINPRFASGSLPTAIESGLNIPMIMLRIMTDEPVGDIDIKYGIRVARYYGWEELNDIE